MSTFRIIAVLIAVSVAGVVSSDDGGSSGVIDISHNGARAVVNLNVYKTDCLTTVSQEPGIMVPDATSGTRIGSVFGVTGISTSSSDAGEGSAIVQNYTYGWINKRVHFAGATFRAGSFTLMSTMTFAELNGIVNLVVYPSDRGSFVPLGGGGSGYKTDTAVIPDWLRPEITFWANSAYMNGYTDGEGGLMDYGAKPIGIRVGSDGFITLFPLSEVSFTGFAKFDTFQLSWVAVAH